MLQLLALTHFLQNMCTSLVPHTTSPPPSVFTICMYIDLLVCTMGRLGWYMYVKDNYVKVCNGDPGPESHWDNIRYKKLKAQVAMVPVRYRLNAASGG